MKITLILLLAALVGVFCQMQGINSPLDTVDGFNQLASWTGDLGTATTKFNAPQPTPAPCTTKGTTNQYPYIVVSYLPTASGVRQVGLMAGKGFGAQVQVFAYAGAFDPANACNNLYRQLINTNGLNGDPGVLEINDNLFFTAGTRMYFVVTTSTFTATGSFALSIFGSSAVGTTVGGPQWTHPDTSAATCTVAPNTTPYNVSTYTFQTMDTGGAAFPGYDIWVLFENTNQTTAQVTQNLLFYAIYQGNFTAADIAANACPGTAYVIGGSQGDLQGPIYYFTNTNFQSNRQYTIAVSSNNPSNFALQILVSRTKLHVPGGNFAQPTRGSVAGNCALNSTASGAGYVVANIASAAYNTHFFEVAGQVSFTTVQDFPNYGFVYGGTISSNPQATVNGCTSATFAGAADIFVPLGTVFTANGPFVASTTIGQPYSLVVSTANGQNLESPPPSGKPSGYGAQIWVLAGPSQSAITPSTTAGTSTSGATSATGATSTTGTVTGSTNNATVTTGASTGGSTSGATGATTSTTAPAGTTTSSTTTPTGSTGTPTGSSTTAPTGSTGTTSSGSGTTATSTTSGASALSFSALFLVAVAFFAL